MSRVFATSDIHVDYSVNAQWIAGLSIWDHGNDILIVAGDVSDSLDAIERSLTMLAMRFRKVLFVPGNHELWVLRGNAGETSFTKFESIRRVVERSGASMQPYTEGGLSIVPLLSWYDYSFGQPTQKLRAMWMDYRACRWPEQMEAHEIAAWFHALNPRCAPDGSDIVISFSHFLPRIDVMPAFIPPHLRALYPVLGSARLDEQVRALGASIHVYGHSHVNRRVRLDGITYINNAYGYPEETAIASKKLLRIHPN